MPYRAVVAVDFPCPRRAVYDALCDLDRYPEWNAGMTSISHQGPMRPGLTYATTTDVLGKENEATVEVLDMVPDQAIVLRSSAGLVMFQATFDLKELTLDQCVVTCSLRMEFSKALFNLAQPVAEAIAETRIRNDLETLRSQLAPPS